MLYLEAWDLRGSGCRGPDPASAKGADVDGERGRRYKYDLGVLEGD